ncbi:MAG TPA: hypothetical protein VGF77_18370 [Allosphingosinicella sp.]|jgi:hypothetical protein
MKDGLLERMRATGHWRVVLRPIAPLSERLSFKQCATLVENARVSLRGWDYPHISHRQDQQGGSGRTDSYYENWCDWMTQVEFWRMYRSGQFLSYNALDDDLRHDPQPMGDERYLNVVGAIYQVAEIVEFTHRLAAAVDMDEGIGLQLSLVNTYGRHLQAGRGRMPFFDVQRAGSETIAIERQLDPAALKKGAPIHALSVLLELFDCFGWNPEPNQIRGDIEGLYRREFR